MSRIVLDIETTGLEVSLGNRIIEIACIELDYRKRSTDKRFHTYLNPEREIEEEAGKVHGLTTDFLKDKPKFSDIADELFEFLEGAELVIHNAEFDLKFLNHEFKQTGKDFPALEDVCKVTDTLLLSREKRPGGSHSLDALANRYEVDSSKREKRKKAHGALVDTEMLAEVYAAMTGGQSSFEFDAVEKGSNGGGTTAPDQWDGGDVIIITPTKAELQAHEKFLDYLDKESTNGSIWRQNAAGQKLDSNQ